MTNDSLDDILTKVSAIVSQTTTTDDTSTEYGLWKTYANMAQKEWAETYEWPSLFREYHTKTTSTSANATVTLPGDFRKLAGFPKATEDGSNTYDYIEIDPLRKDQYDAGDRYCYVVHGTADAALYFHPSTSNLLFASGASIYVPYWKSPASLASPANVIECPNPEYMVQRIIAYAWESREDARYLQAKAEAEKLLSRMLEFEMSKGEGHTNRIQTEAQSRYGFRLGRD